VESVRDFNLMLDGALLHLRIAEDRAGIIALYTLLAQGVTYPETPAPPKANAPTLERVLGRPAVDLAAILRGPRDPAVVAAEDEAAAERREEAAAKLALAQLQLFEAQVRASRPDIIEEEPAAPAEPPSPARA
jgi:hypothetical protein